MGRIVTTTVREWYGIQNGVQLKKPKLKLNSMLKLKPLLEKRKTARTREESGQVRMVREDAPGRKLNDER